jgi:hypothetical protein
MRAITQATTKDGVLRAWKEVNRYVGSLKQPDASAVLPASNPRDLHHPYAISIDAFDPPEQLSQHGTDGLKKHVNHPVKRLAERVKKIAKRRDNVQFLERRRQAAELARDQLALMKVSTLNEDVRYLKTLLVLTAHRELVPPEFKMVRMGHLAMVVMPVRSYVMAFVGVRWTSLRVLCGTVWLVYYRRYVMGLHLWR